jgi:long-chain acyl-CoA synthetase
MASHPLDLQDFPSLGSEDKSTPPVAHVGPPSINTEVKLVGLNDEAVEGGADPSGMLLIRGPSVGKVLSNGDDFVKIPTEDEQEGWVPTGVKAKVQTNGAFLILS